MTDTNKNWRTILLDAHPRLFNASANHPEGIFGYPECGEGGSALLTRLCARIDAALGPAETIRVAQIKEKFAGLRFYWHGEVSAAARDAIQVAISLAEARSVCTCEECGAEGALFRYGGTYMTRCAVHAKGQPVPAEPGMENVHVVRRAVDGGFRKFARRYDRETDTFVEADLSSSDNEG